MRTFLIAFGVFYGVSTYKRTVHFTRFHYLFFFWTPRDEINMPVWTIFIGRRCWALLLICLWFVGWKQGLKKIHTPDTSTVNGKKPTPDLWLSYKYATIQNFFFRKFGGLNYSRYYADIACQFPNENMYELGKFHSTNMSKSSTLNYCCRKVAPSSGRNYSTKSLCFTNFDSMFPSFRLGNLL